MTSRSAFGCCYSYCRHLLFYFRFRFRALLLSTLVLLLLLLLVLLLVLRLVLVLVCETILSVVFFVVSMSVPSLPVVLRSLRGSLFLLLVLVLFLNDDEDNIVVNLSSS